MGVDSASVTLVTGPGSWSSGPLNPLSPELVLLGPPKVPFPQAALGKIGVGCGLKPGKPRAGEVVSAEASGQQQQSKVSEPHLELGPG